MPFLSNLCISDWMTLNSHKVCNNSQRLIWNALSVLITLPFRYCVCMVCWRHMHFIGIIFNFSPFANKWQKLSAQIILIYIRYKTHIHAWQSMIRILTDFFVVISVTTTQMPYIHGQTLKSEEKEIFICGRDREVMKRDPMFVQWWCISWIVCLQII